MIRFDLNGLPRSAPIIDAKGNLTSEWLRWFASAQALMLLLGQRAQETLTPNSSYTYQGQTWRYKGGPAGDEANWERVS